MNEIQKGMKVKKTQKKQASIALYSSKTKGNKKNQNKTRNRLEHKINNRFSILSLFDKNLMWSYSLTLKQLIKLPIFYRSIKYAPTM